MECHSETQSGNTMCFDYPSSAECNVNNRQVLFASTQCLQLCPESCSCYTVQDEVYGVVSG